LNLREVGSTTSETSLNIAINACLKQYLVVPTSRRQSLRSGGEAGGRTPVGKADERLCGEANPLYSFKTNLFSEIIFHHIKNMLI